MVSNDVEAGRACSSETRPLLPRKTYTRKSPNFQEKLPDPEKQAWTSTQLAFGCVSFSMVTLICLNLMFQWVARVHANRTINPIATPSGQEVGVTRIQRTTKAWQVLGRANADLTCPLPCPFTSKLPTLHIITTSGTETITQTAKMQSSWSKWLADQDDYTHVCDPGCEITGNGAVNNIVVMDYGLADGNYSHSPWRNAQTKFKFGLVHKVKELDARGSPQPDWWLIKDSDTYVHAGRLMSKVQHLNPDDPISISAADPLKHTPLGCKGICSGAGWLISRALALKLAFEHGDRWMNLPVVDYSWQIPEVLSWISDVKTIALPEMSLVGPILLPSVVGIDFASWHMKPELQVYSLDNAIQYAERYLSDSAIKCACGQAVVSD